MTSNINSTVLIVFLLIAIILLFVQDIHGHPGVQDD